MDEWSVVVLAGGIGSRLHPLTIEIPKPMVPVANKPMIDYNLELLRNAGINGKIIIVTKYLHEEIRKYFKESEHFNDLDIVIPKVDPLDTADAVRKVSDYINTDSFIVSMADIVTNLQLTDFMVFHREKDCIASITLKDVSYPRAFGVIMLNQDSRIVLFLEKPLPQELGLATLTFAKKETIRLQSNLVNTGIYAFKHKVLDILDTLTDLMDFGKHVFPYLAREYGIYGYERLDYYWMDAGNPQTYLYTNWDVLRRWSFPYFPKATWEENSIWWDGLRPEIPLTVRIIAPTAMGSNISLGNNTTIGPLVAIGENVNIGENTIIQSSVVWDNVKIGRNVSIKESIICNDVSIPDDSKLTSGTVIAPHTHFKTALFTKKGQIVESAVEKLR
ncbi:MAG: sugar phosphate nucleotidyltransferase [Candidatus Hodarchaeota archaeon]